MIVQKNTGWPNLPVFCVGFLSFFVCFCSGVYLSHPCHSAFSSCLTSLSLFFLLSPYVSIEYMSVCVPAVVCSSENHLQSKEGQHLKTLEIKLVIFADFIFTCRVDDSKRGSLVGGNRQSNHDSIIKQFLMHLNFGFK